MVLQVQDMDRVLSQECSPSCAKVSRQWMAITERSLEDDYPDAAELVSAQARQALISLTEGEVLELVKNASRFERNPFWVGSSEKVAVQV